jgi:3-oxoacyl-[acyl-carrier-protein] synthase I
LTLQVPIVSHGVRSAVGLAAAPFAAAVRAGIRRIADHPFMVDRRGNPVPAALVTNVDPALAGSVRVAALACGALEEALRPLPQKAKQRGALDVLLALPEARPGLSERDAAYVAAAVGAAISSAGVKRPVVEVAGRGHAGALDAVRLAAERVEARRSELCAIVAADSYFEADTIDWLDSHLQIASEGIRDGFPLGEAGGALVVADRTIARSLRIAPLGYVQAAKSAIEPRPIKGPTECLGQGLSEAVSAVVSTLRLPSEAVDDVFCDINGERYRSQEWALTVLRLGAALRTTQYTSVVSSCGDVGAASGALLCVLALRAWARGYASGDRALVWCGSESGRRAALLLEHAPPG